VGRGEWAPLVDQCCCRAEHRKRARQAFWQVSGEVRDVAERDVDLVAT